MSEKHNYVKVPTYGAHAYRILKDFDPAASFPPEGAKFIAVLPGRFSKAKEPPKEWLDSVKRSGATHLALGQGENFLVRKL